MCSFLRLLSVIASHWVFPLSDLYFFASPTRPPVTVPRLVLFTLSFLVSVVPSLHVLSLPLFNFFLFAHHNVLSLVCLYFISSTSLLFLSPRFILSFRVGVVSSLPSSLVATFMLFSL